MLLKNKFLISLFTLLIVSYLSASPIYEPSENLVEDNNIPDNNDDLGFERTNDGFSDMNDFNFNEDSPSQQDANNNQSMEQNDDDAPSNARERNAPEMNKATADEDTGGEDEGSNEASGGRPHRKSPKYQDANEENRGNGDARSLANDFEPFDKDTDKETDSDSNNKNEFDGANGSGELSGRPPMNGDEERGVGGLRGDPNMPPPGLQILPGALEQIDEPIIMNPGPPIPLQLHNHGGARANSEENGGNYKQKPKKTKKPNYNNGAPGLHARPYKFLPDGIKYFNNENGSKSRITPPHDLTSYHFNPLPF